jgi:hypothetical protein
MFKMKYTHGRYSLRLPPVKVYGLVLFALAIVLFSRILEVAGAPSLINFVHFALVPITLGLASFMVGPELRAILAGLCAVLAVILLSALINGAGAINVALEFLLLAEPFMLLGAIVSVPWSSSSIRRFRYWLLAFTAANVLFIYFQRFVQGLTDDGVQGIFVDMGGGAHAASAIALVAAVYFFARLGVRSLILRVALVLVCAATVVFTDSKQLLIVFTISVFALALTKWRQLGYILRYLALLGLLLAITVWMAATFFPAIATWADSTKFIVGFEQKLTVFPLIASFYDSPLNVLFGLGPGHTVGRLGYLLPDYYQYLGPLGATTSPVTEAVWQANQAHWISNSVTGSSMWSLLFSWAGIWGDLGLLGLGVYLCFWWWVWRRLCPTDVSRFFLISILVLGAIFAWLEEPPFMLFIASLIGLEWQEHQSRLGTLDRGSLAQRTEEKTPAVQPVR